MRDMRSSAEKAAEKALQAYSTFRKKRREMHFYHLEDNKNLSWRIKLSYCAPTMSTLPIVLLLAAYGTQFYEKLGAELAYISFFIALARSFDVVSDPIMSYVTDSFRSKHGRRRPFIITGCWVYSILLIFLLSPPRLTSIQLSYWFGFFYVLFFLASTYTNIPYDALGPELTDSYDDRSRLFFVSGLFDGFGSLMAALFPGMLTVYINFTRPCPDIMDHCYSESGTGQSCYTISGTHDYTLFDITDATNGTMDYSTYNSTNCVELFQGKTGSGECIPGIDCFCSCSLVCKRTCELENTRRAYMLVGLFFGVWYCVTMVNCFLQIRERCQVKTKEKDETPTAPPPPMVPSMLNTLQNEPFKLLLPAWACDAVTNGIVSSMMTFYVRYVITPEYAEGCEGDPSVSWKCNSQLVLGASIVMLLLTALLSCPIWLFIIGKIGKRNSWLAWSCSMACTNILFIFLGPGDVVLCIIVTGINGFPIGAKFLADAILADIIDYDEFLSGARSEATYTMFKSFLPKICAIPASAIPIALLNSVGHVAPIDGVVQPQPPGVQVYVRIVCVILPTVISLIGFLIKIKFPFKTREQVDKIAEGVGRHLMKEAGLDPISGKLIDYIPTTVEQQVEIYRLDYFPSISFLEEFIEGAQNQNADGENLYASKLYKKTKFYRNFALCSFFSFIGISYGSFGLMTSKEISFIPVLSIIGVGVSFTMSGFFHLQTMGAQSLLKKPPTSTILEIALRQRKNIDQTHVTIKKRSTLPK